MACVLMTGVLVTGVFVADVLVPDVLAADVFTAACLPVAPGCAGAGVAASAEVVSRRAPNVPVMKKV